MVLLFVVQILLSQTPANEDCVSYNPRTLNLEQNELTGFWFLHDDHSSMLMFASEEDAQNGLALASRYSQQCFIGRHASTRSVREPRRIILYWNRPTGKQTKISAETCQAYTGSALQLEDKGGEGWIVTDGKGFQVAVDNEADAQRLVAVARQFTSHCTIGGANPLSPARRVDYWK